MPKFLAVLLTLAITGARLLSPVHAETPDRTLLATFCDPAHIKGATCKRAKNYPDAPRGGCDVTLSKERYGGRFIAPGSQLLVVSYDSGCEAHATDNGGSAVFEEIGGRFVFRNFQPGMQSRDCVVTPKNDQQDFLICLTGHIGQGTMETGVALMAFTRNSDKRISLDFDFLLNAEDTVGSFGANVVTCKQGEKYFELSKLGKGPRPQTVVVEARFADAATARTACNNGFPKPKETFGDLIPGDAYVPEGFEKHGRVVIDLATRKISME